MYEIELPEAADQSEECIRRLVDEGESVRNIRQVDWWLVHYYMQGARAFSGINYLTGQVSIDYASLEGTGIFKYEEIVTKFQAQLGRLMKIDLRPRVTKLSVGLEDLRRASVGQMVLDTQFTESTLQEVKRLLLPPLLKYGKMGLTIWIAEDGRAFIDVIPPWELLPIPPNPLEETELGGIVRKRRVPLPWVQSLPGVPGKNAQVWTQMTKQSVPAGQIQQSFDTSFRAYAGSALSSAPSSGPSGKQDQTMVDTVDFVEVWVKDATGRLKEYSQFAGGKRVQRQYYEPAARTAMPITVCGDIATGGFWDRSFCSTLLPLNIEIENSLAQLFENLSNIDLYGLVYEPTTLGVPSKAIRGKDGIKRIRFEPDPSAPDLKPFNLPPATSGTMPIEGLRTGMGVLDRLANQPTELMSGAAPGRVDNSKGLGFLYETSNTPISPTAESIARAITECYKAALDLIRIKWTSNRIVDVTLLDDSLAGIEMDSATGQVTLDPSKIPTSQEVNITVQSVQPKSREQEKFELQESLTRGSIDMFEYRIEVRKRGLEIPVGNEAEWQNFRRAVMENILLFGNGERPGRVTVSNNDMHAVHQRVLQAFMARPEFMLASVEVRNAFQQHYQYHQLSMGQYPDQMSLPEDAALEQQQMIQMMQQQQMSGAEPGAGMVPAGQNPEMIE